MEVVWSTTAGCAGVDALALKRTATRSGEVGFGPRFIHIISLLEKPNAPAKTGSFCICLSNAPFVNDFVFFAKNNHAWLPFLGLLLTEAGKIHDRQ